MRLGEMLIKAGVVTDLQLNAAVAEQQRWGGKLGQILVRMGALSEDLLVLALCRQLALPRADLDALTAVPDALKERLDRATCEKYHVLPTGYVQERRAVQLAMSDPFDVVAVDDLTRLLGTKIEPFLAGDAALSSAIRRLYGAATPTALGARTVSLEMVDNLGTVRGPMRPATKPAPALVLPPPPAAGASPTFAARVDEQHRFVRAVANLLAERGYIPRSIPRIPK